MLDALALECVMGFLEGEVADDVDAGEGVGGEVPEGDADEGGDLAEAAEDVSPSSPVFEVHISQSDVGGDRSMEVDTFVVDSVEEVANSLKSLKDEGVDWIFAEGTEYSRGTTARGNLLQNPTKNR